MRVAKAHPIANWLRVEGHLYSRTLDQVLRFRDEELITNPSASGVPDSARDWFWFVQLPTLVTDPKLRDQVWCRINELTQKHNEIDCQLRRQAGSLIDQQTEIQTEIALLQQVLGENDDQH